MSDYKIIPHTADLRIEVAGNNLSELFINSANALFSVAEADLRNEQVTHQIQISAETPEDLLVDFLNELIFLSDTHNEVYNDIIIGKINETSLDAELRGFKVKSFKLDIKAATYHGLAIQKTKDGYKTQIVFDI